jgi:hypothetical protein
MSRVRRAELHCFAVGHARITTTSALKVHATRTARRPAIIWRDV